MVKVNINTNKSAKKKRNFHGKVERKTNEQIFNRTRSDKIEETDDWRQPAALRHIINWMPGQPLINTHSVIDKHIPLNSIICFLKEAVPDWKCKKTPQLASPSYSCHHKIYWKYTSYSEIYWKVGVLLIYEKWGLTFWAKALRQREAWKLFVRFYTLTKGLKR